MSSTTGRMQSLALQLRFFYSQRHSGVAVSSFFPGGSGTIGSIWAQALAEAQQAGTAPPNAVVVTQYSTRARANVFTNGVIVGPNFAGPGRTQTEQQITLFHEMLHVLYRRSDRDLRYHFQLAPRPEHANYNHNQLISEFIRQDCPSNMTLSTGAPAP